MLFVATTLIVFFFGLLFQAVMHARREKKLINDLVKLRREKFDRDLADVKKNISDDINSMPLEDLVRRK